MVETEKKNMSSRAPRFTLCVIGMCVVSSKIDALATLFVYDIGAVFKGEIWRLVTSHFVHFGDMHLIYNTIVFGVTGWILEYNGYRYFKHLCMSAACSIGVALMIFKPDMIRFGGLSGIACGAITYCSLLCLRKPSPWRNISILTIILLLLKISLEIYNDGSLLPYEVAQSFVPVPLSHIVGSLTAIILFFLTQNNIFIHNELSCEANRLLQDT